MQSDRIKIHVRLCGFTYQQHLPAFLSLKDMIIYDLDLDLKVRILEFEHDHWADGA